MQLLWEFIVLTVEPGHSLTHSTHPSDYSQTFEDHEGKESKQALSKEVISQVLTCFDKLKQQGLQGKWEFDLPKLRFLKALLQECQKANEKLVGASTCLCLCFYWVRPCPAGGECCALVPVIFQGPGVPAGS
jgi:hypothetical protein